MTTSPATPISEEERSSVAAAIFVRAAILHAAFVIGGGGFGTDSIPGFSRLFGAILAPMMVALDFLISESRAFWSSYLPALIFAAIWGAVQRARGSDRNLRELARTMCSYALGAQIIVFALIKFVATPWVAGLGRPSV